MRTDTRTDVSRSQPGDVRSQPVVGFHVASVHSIELRSAILPSERDAAEPVPDNGVDV